MLRIGEKIDENLEFEVFYNGESQKVRIGDYKGKWLVLIFYPGDFTFVCPTELEEAAGLYDEFQKEGAEVFSVSTDSVFVHKAWKDKSVAIKKIQFPMVADPTGKLCKLFGTYIEEEGVSLRGTFIISPDLELKAMELHHNDIGRNAKEALRKVQAAKFVYEHGGEVCPASWSPGGKTLKPGMGLVGEI